jgi:GMP synthase (glutamine-hydrolysing)
LIKRFLILQLHPESDAADGEFAAILDKCHLADERSHRIRLDQQNLPECLDVTDYAGVIVGPGFVSDAPEDRSSTEARIEAQIMGLMPQITGTDHPFMGCCYGLGILTEHLGGDVSKA